MLVAQNRNMGWPPMSLGETHAALDGVAAATNLRWTSSNSVTGIFVDPGSFTHCLPSLVHVLRLSHLVVPDSRSSSRTSSPSAKAIGASILTVRYSMSLPFKRAIKPVGVNHLLILRGLARPSIFIMPYHAVLLVRQVIGTLFCRTIRSSRSAIHIRSSDAMNTICPSNFRCGIAFVRVSW